MSLINQVLQNVEARQGGAVLSTASGAVWGAEQVKPVLAHASHSSRWISRLIWIMLLAMGVSALVLKAPMLSDVRWFSRPISTVPAVSNIAPVSVPVESPLLPPDSQAVAPQLTKTLFSTWQEPRPSRGGGVQPAMPAALSQPSRPVAPQVESEVNRHTAEPSNPGQVQATTVSTVEITAVKPAEDTATGSVSKQVRPEQEVNVQIQRAVDHEQKGRLSESLSILRQVLLTAPQSEDARQLLAAYLFESKQEPEAVAVLQAGMKQFPAQIGLAKSLAKWQLAHGQPDAVIQTLRPIASQFAQDAESQWMLAMAYQQAGQHSAALPHFERATLLKPGAAQWVVAYAISLQAAGQNAQALQQLQLAQSWPMSERLLEFVSQRIRQLGGTVQARGE